MHLRTSTWLRRTAVFAVCLALLPTAGLARAAFGGHHDCPHSAGRTCECDTAKVCHRKAPEPEQLPACHRAAQESDSGSKMCSARCGGHDAPDLGFGQEIRLGPIDLLGVEGPSLVDRWIVSLDVVDLGRSPVPPLLPPRSL